MEKMPGITLYSFRNKELKYVEPYYHIYDETQANCHPDTKAINQKARKLNAEIKQRNAPNESHNQKIYTQTKRIIQEMILQNDTEESMGELFLIDLLLGNFDRFWESLHGGNILFAIDVKRVNDDFCFTSIESDKPIYAIDQTLSAYGQYIMLGGVMRGIKNSFTEENAKIKCAQVASSIESVSLNHLKFQKNMAFQIEELRKFFKNLLDNLISSELDNNMVSTKLGRTLPIAHHPLQGFMPPNYKFIDFELGMIRALLQIETVELDIIATLNKIQYQDFEHEARYFIDLCRMLADLVRTYDKSEIYEKMAVCRYRHQENPTLEPKKALKNDQA